MNTENELSTGAAFVGVSPVGLVDMVGGNTAATVGGFVAAMLVASLVEDVAVAFGVSVRERCVRRVLRSLNSPPPEALSSGD